MKVIIDISEDKHDLVCLAATSGIDDWAYKIIASGTPLPENTMIIDKDKLSCDCEWDDYCDGYTAYSPLALEAAEVENADSN